MIRENILIEPHRIFIPDGPDILKENNFEQIYGKLQANYF